MFKLSMLQYAVNGSTMDVMLVLKEPEAKQLTDKNVAATFRMCRIKDATYRDHQNISVYTKYWDELCQDAERTARLLKFTPESAYMQPMKTISSIDLLLGAYYHQRFLKYASISTAEAENCFSKSMKHGNYFAFCRLLNLLTEQVEEAKEQSDKIQHAIAAGINLSTRFASLYGTPAFIKQALFYLSVANYYQSIGGVAEYRTSIEALIIALLAAKKTVSASKVGIAIASDNQGVDYLVRHRLTSTYGATSLADLISKFSNNYSATLQSSRAYVESVAESTAKNYCTFATPRSG